MPSKKRSHPSSPPGGDVVESAPGLASAVDSPNDRMGQCRTVTQAVDAALRWLAARTVHAAGASGTPPLLACLRLVRPAGTLRSVRLFRGAAPAEARVHAPRASVAGIGANVAAVSLRAREGDPLLEALRAVEPEARGVLAAPVWGVQGLWGLVCRTVDVATDPGAAARDEVGLTAQSLTAFLESQPRVLGATVAEAHPRAPLELNAFLARVEKSLDAGRGSDERHRSGVSLLVYSCGALVPNPTARRRWIHTVARAALAAMRDGDYAAVLGDEALAFALHRADPGACGAVAFRIRETLSKQLVEGALGGFAFRCFPAGATVKVSDLAELAAAARAKRVMKTR